MTTTRRRLHLRIALLFMLISCEAFLHSIRLLSRHHCMMPSTVVHCHHIPQYYHHLHLVNNQYRQHTTDKLNENTLESTIISLTARRYPSLGTNDVGGDDISKGGSTANRFIPAALAALTSISLILGQAYAFENVELLDDARQATFPSTSSIIVVQKEELPSSVSFTRNGLDDSISDVSSTGQNLYVQFDTPTVTSSKAITQPPEPKVIIEQTGQTVKKVSKPKLTEPEVMLTKQKDRRSGSYSKPKPPDLKVILENEPSPLKNKALPPPQPEITVLLETSSPKGIDPAPVEDETSPPSQKTESQTLKSETKTEVTPAKKKLEVEPIRPEAKYIKGSSLINFICIRIRYTLLLLPI